MAAAWSPNYESFSYFCKHYYATAKCVLTIDRSVVPVRRMYQAIKFSREFDGENASKIKQKASRG